MRLFKVAVVLGVLGAAPAMFGDVIDYMLNDSGSTYCDQGSGASPCGVTGLTNDPNVTSSTLDTSLGGTGLGTVSLTIGGGTIGGNYTVGLWIFEAVTPESDYDEYGAFGGPLSAGESWQIDTPDYYLPVASGDPNTSAQGTIIANTAAGTLADANYVPGQTDSITGGAGGLCISTPDPSCNDFTSLALSYNFSLVGGDSETLNFTVSDSAPAAGTFYLEQLDPGEVTGTPAAIYYSLSAAYTPPVPPSGVPEPSYFLPLFALAGVSWLVSRRRSAAV
jgi:hypothetical protein